MADTPNPAPISDAEARAMDMMVKIRELVRTFSGFTFVGKARRAKIANYTKVTDEFFELLALAIESNPDLAAAGPVTVEELRAVVATCRAFNPAIVEMDTQTQGLKDSLAEYRGDVGRRALNAYNAAQRLRKQEDRKDLVPHRTALRRALPLGRPKKDNEVETAARKAARAAAAEVRRAAAATKEVPK